MKSFSFAKNALVALSCALLLSFFIAPALKAADSAPALPLDVKIEKVTGKEKAYVVKLTNTSKETLNVSAKVLLAVAFHGEDRARKLPAHKIEAGKEWTIDDLVFDDHVIVTADGHAPLEIKVK